MRPVLPGTDTIFAPASGQGRSAVTLVRISGPASECVLDRLLSGRIPAPRSARLRRLREPSTGAVLDHALVIWMPGPSTFTGEDQAELHLHGGRAILSAVLRVLADLPGCRAAEPGEFTRRAFLNGKLDLTAVEGLADLIDAETEAQRKQALRQLDGALGAEAARWRDRLLDALAACEAELDFADEDDVPEDAGHGAADVALSIRDEVAATLGRADSGERIRDGFRVVIAGAPNAGKSTLLNAIARRDVAIVSPLPGTTRDALEIHCDLGGLPVVFVDTAGVRESDDELERIGMARTRERLDAADLVLWLEAPDAGGIGVQGGMGLNGTTPLLHIATKIDLAEAGPAADLGLSAMSGEGVRELLDQVRAAAEPAMEASAGAVPTRMRHRAILREIVASLDRAGQAGPTPVELLAEDLRLALRHLGRMTGTVDVEEVLDRIFAGFCIGK